MVEICLGLSIVILLATIAIIIMISRDLCKIKKDIEKSRNLLDAELQHAKNINKVINDGNKNV